METLLALLLFALALYAYYVFIFIPRRLKKLEKSNVIFIPEQEIYAVPIEVLKEIQNYSVEIWQPVSRPKERGRYPTEIQKTRKVWVVKSIRPELSGSSIAFVEMSHRIDEVKIIDEEKRLNLDSQVMRQISVPVKELYFQLEPGLLELNQKVRELERIERLTRSSEVYSKQAALYARAVSQLRNLIREGEELRGECLRFIRETLIGAEVSKFEPDTLPDTLAWKLQFQTKYRAINEQYQTLRDEVKVLSTLRRGIDSV